MEGQPPELRQEQEEPDGEEAHKPKVGESAWLAVVISLVLPCLDTKLHSIHDICTTFPFPKLYACPPTTQPWQQDENLGSIYAYAAVAADKLAAVGALGGSSHPQISPCTWTCHSVIMACAATPLTSWSNSVKSGPFKTKSSLSSALNVFCSPWISVCIHY